MGNELGRRDADEARRQATLRDKRMVGPCRNSTHRTSDLNVLGQVEIMCAGLPRRLRHAQIAVIRQAGNDGIDRVVDQVLGQRDWVRRVQREADQVRGPVRTHHGVGSRTVDITELNLVTPGFCKQS
jgi:hypothetical protein